MEVLRLREFRLLFSAQAVSNLGDRMVPIALAFAVLELGGSAAEVGIVMACRTFPLVATLIIGGVVADRVSRRTVMIVSDVVRVFSQGVPAAVLIAGVAQVWELAVLAGVTGAAGGFFYSAVVVGYDRVKQFGPLHWKEEKRQLSIWKKFVPCQREPDGIGKANVDFVLWCDERHGTKQSITQSAGILLHHIADGSRADSPAEVTDDIGFGRRDHEADAIHAAGQHTLKQVFRDRTWALNISLATGANGKQLF